MLFADGNKVTYKIAPRPKKDVVIAKVNSKVEPNNKKTQAKSKAKVTTKKNISAKSNNISGSKTKQENTEVKTKQDISSATIIAKELAPRTDEELDDDLGAEVLFVTGAENSLKDERSIAPRTDSELDADLVE